MTEIENRSKKHSIMPAIVAVIAAIAIISAAPKIYAQLCLYADYRHAVNCMDSGEFQEAIEIFSSLGDYRHSEKLVTQSKYGLAVDYIDKGSYSAAIEILDSLGAYPDAQAQLKRAYFLLGAQQHEAGDFESAILSLAKAGTYDGAAEEILLTYSDWGISLYTNGNYEAATEKLLLAGNITDDTSVYLSKSYLGWAGAERKTGEYAHAIELYFLSGDTSAETVYNTDLCYYDWGHEMFMQSSYKEAEELFSSMTNDRWNIETPHFLSLDNAMDYIFNCSLDLQEKISFYVPDPPYNGTHELFGFSHGNKVLALSHAAQTECSTATFNKSEKLITLEPEYYPGRRIFAAWRDGDTSGLSSRETELLEKSLKIVDEAKRSSTTDFELELWIIDWLCDNVTFDEDSDKYPYVGKLRENWTAVGAILDGHALCQGYSDAFYLLGSLAGFDIRYQGGYCYDRNYNDDPWRPHVWNSINLGGDWYYVDVTWCDTNDDGHSRRWYVNFVDDVSHQLDECPPLAPISAETKAEADWFTVSGKSFSDVDAAADSIAKNIGTDTAFRVETICDYNHFNDALQKITRANGSVSGWYTWQSQQKDCTLFYIKWQ